ncbi:hypothetical protein HWQ46_26425 [Shewanella sp. D64]|jgi:hypothetical protein|uniref:hypothetical protein n=1 Tax=unclassified Shewanella TaxID=196818 RepID=UPI0022BA1C45|nr:MULTISPECIES: hypothetical protein [unclassified Shewanella]MEC4729053.1 hypothetical protein [Shewanella sp. D64]MEC4737888.1 hypothetical protein [Shewanella sp. E94]WBJ93859.1 hypothetical protein HWQ47_18260 [Shewanella sp. MTB7]
MNKLIVLIFSLLTSNVMAATAICTGKVDRLAYHQPDGLYLRVADSGIMKVCNPQVKFYRTSPESCKLIATLATTARATDKSVQIYIDNAPGTNCSSITNWFSADIRFVELLK